MTMPQDTELRLHDRCLCGALPEPLAGASSSKTGQLAALGWRIIPVPEFWPAGRMWNNGKGKGNPPTIDFRHPRDWLVIPPAASAVCAKKIEGRIRAIRWAFEQATAGGAA